MILGLMLVAIVLQALGYTSTCTQGANGTFITGAVLSLPFMMVSILLLVKHIVWPKVMTEDSFKPYKVYLTSIMLAAIVMCIFNSNTVYLTLWLGAGPCGMIYEIYAPRGAYDEANILIGLVYGVVPAVIAIMALTKMILMNKAKRFKI